MCLYYFHTSDGYSQSSIYMRTNEESGGEGSELLCLLLAATMGR